MYLAASSANRPDDVNAYAASTFYAVDRYASYVKVWREYYDEGGVLSDRYTTSNAVHQGGKLPPEAREDFFRWLYDFEFAKMGLPKPIWSFVWICRWSWRRSWCAAARSRRTPWLTSTSGTTDISVSAARRRRRLPNSMAGRFVPCARDGCLRSIEEIHEGIYAHVKNAWRDKYGSFDSWNRF
ncbi:MAG: thymidylate kinase [Oscillospiraceae bacterium]